MGDHDREMKEKENGVRAEAETLKVLSPSIGFEEKRLLPFDFPAEMFKILLKPGLSRH